MRRLFLAAVLAVASLAGAAQPRSPGPVRPDVLMSELSTDVMAVIGKEAGAAREQELAELVQARIVPVFDFERMTRIALARNWLVASPAQRLELTAQFKTLLVRTYSQALLGLHGNTIVFKPLRAAPGATEVTVRSSMRRSGVEPLTIDYEMADGAAGWKVYDVQIAGASMVLNYRESFAATVRAEGIDGLIRTLEEKNRRNDARAASDPGLAPVLLLYGAPRAPGR